MKIERLANLFKNLFWWVVASSCKGWSGIWEWREGTVLRGIDTLLLVVAEKEIFEIFCGKINFSLKLALETFVKVMNYSKRSIFRLHFLHHITLTRKCLLQYPLQYSQKKKNCMVFIVFHCLKKLVGLN